MRTHLAGIGLALVVSGCGLEMIFENIGHLQQDRPASTISGTLQFPGATVTVLDANGVVQKPFLPGFDEVLAGTVIDGGTYELRLPSAKYANLVVKAVAGNTTLLALVPSIGEESVVTDVNLDERSTTETLITLARLSSDGSGWRAVTPAVYAQGTRQLIRAGFDTPGPAAELLGQVHRLVAGGTDLQASGTPAFFSAPVLNLDGGVATSPIAAAFLATRPIDYVGDGTPRATSADFDAKLAQVAKLYKPAGCIDLQNIRVMLTVDFNAGRLNGNCGVSDRFKWATDKPGKTMYFVGWIHKDSANQDPTVNALLGQGQPNQLPMKDDGQGGDEVAGDNIWTIYFDVPRGLRFGYKYTWGFRNQPWTGSEEWPGNSRIIQADDLDGDNIVYRRDVFADEATNKDKSNLSFAGHGVLGWDEILRPEFGIETREQQVDLNQDCKPDRWEKPTSVGPYTTACTQ